jgi:two-component system response regulator HydG
MIPAASAPRRRILLVEDDHDAAYFAVHALTTMGQFDVTHTADPRVALDRARSEPWDLVLTDLDLPGITGLELLAELRRAIPALPVVVLTAQPVVGAAPDRLRDRADAYLEKPIPPGHLVAVVTALVGRPAAGPPPSEAPGAAGGR